MSSYTNKEIFKKEVKGYVQKSKGSHFSAGSSAPIDGGRHSNSDDEIREWWGQKPEVIKPGMVKHALRFRALPRFHMRNSPREWFCPGLPR